MNEKLLTGLKIEPTLHVTFTVSDTAALVGYGLIAALVLVAASNLFRR